MSPPAAFKFFPISNYDLASTLSCGQAFRWRATGDAWTGVIGNRWVRLQPAPQGLAATSSGDDANWTWLSDYLQLEMDLEAVLAAFPQDDPMRSAIQHCRGLRLVRQDPWECLASFILSSTKQIVQIQQIIELLCSRYGDPVPVPRGTPPAFAFPAPRRIASLSESELRACKMGFRAPYLLATARAVSEGGFNLEKLRGLPLRAAREELIQLPGVGRKIADCVLLFAYGFPGAFPVDVWVTRALQQLYFPKRKPSPKRLLKFSETYFGSHAGYAQQYLFHYIRTRT